MVVEEEYLKLYEKCICVFWKGVKSYFIILWKRKKFWWELWFYEVLCENISYLKYFLKDLFFCIVFSVNRRFNGI